MAPKKPTVVFVLGGPGAGKGTQCERIVEQCKGWEHISAGDCLREERQNPDSKDGQLINEYIKEGKIVPVEITVKLLQKKMEAATGKSKFLIDGYPRNLDNVRGWESVIGDAAVVKGVFFFDCPEEAMEARLLERGKTSGRADDNLESIKKRFRTYLSDTMPIVESYEKKGLVMKIDANRDVDDVWHTVKTLVSRVEGPPLRKPKFVKVKAVKPDGVGLNLLVKALADPETSGQGDRATVLVGDESGAVKLLLAGGAPAYVKAGASLRVQNAKVRMLGGYVHAEINKWAVVKEAAEPHTFEAKSEPNVSAVEYELAA